MPASHVTLAGGGAFTLHYGAHGMELESRTEFAMTADLTDAQVAEANEALLDLARLLGRVNAQACHEPGIEFDMDDPQVAREIIMVTFEALVFSKPWRGPRARKKEH